MSALQPFDVFGGDALILQRAGHTISHAHSGLLSASLLVLNVRIGSVCDHFVTTVVLVDVDCSKSLTEIESLSILQVEDTPR